MTTDALSPDDFFSEEKPNYMQPGFITSITEALAAFGLEGLVPEVLQVMQKFSGDAATNYIRWPPEMTEAVEEYHGSAGHLVPPEFQTFIPDETTGEVPLQRELTIIKGQNRAS